ncbi:MAG: DUF1294 domain-containing protein [Tepidisphaeraceae bacterium]
MIVVTFIAYGLDRSAAGCGRRRVPEATLHLLELLGGWPGALLGMRAFRHKRRKATSAIVVWLIATAHGAIWLYILQR